MTFVERDTDECGHHTLGDREDVAGFRGRAAIIALEHSPVVHADQDCADVVEPARLVKVEEVLDPLIEIR